MIHIHDLFAGKADQVPDLFFVKTRFVCVCLLPIMPTDSWLIPDGPALSYLGKGIRVGVNAKSILFCWFRFALGCLLFFSITGAVVIWTDLMANGGAVWFMGVIAVLAALLWWLSYRWSQASWRRAVKVAKKAGIAPELLARAFVNRLSEEEIRSMIHEYQGERSNPLEAR